MIVFLISFISFLLAGFGLGGGVLFIPLSVWALNIEHTFAQYMGLIAYIPAALGVIIKNRKNIKKYYEIIKYVPIGLIGAILGSVISQKFSIEWLKKFYGVFLILFGFTMIFNVISNKNNDKSGFAGKNNKIFCKFYKKI